MMSEQEIDAVTTTTNKGNQTLKEIRRNDINSDETGTLRIFFIRRENENNFISNFLIDERIKIIYYLIFYLVKRCG